MMQAFYTCHLGLDREFGVLPHPRGEASERCCCLFNPLVKLFVECVAVADGGSEIPS